MENLAFETYLDDDSRRGDPLPGSAVGSAGGAACGDRLQISLLIADGRLSGVRQSASGCAAARAAAAAAAELVEGMPLLEAALLDPQRISAELGGLSPVGSHAADLAAEAVHRALGVAVSTALSSLLDPPELGERVLVAVSGGVDSAVAMLREREAGNEVVAVTLELWSDPANDGERSCCSAESVRTARAMSHAMEVPHLTVDLRERFREGVVQPFLDGYAAGATPNPCVGCNGRVRLAPMVGIADRLGAVGLATGHYARIERTELGPLLSPGVDPAKDQTYMLAALPTELLAKLRFPLGELRKSEVREQARAAGLAVADRAESQDLCFLSGVGKAGFLAEHGGLKESPGEIVDPEGAVLGTHVGHHLFTVGQRKGIGVGGTGSPLYVLAVDPEANRVVVGGEEGLLADEVEIGDVTLSRPAAVVDGVRLRDRSRRLPCAVEPDEVSSAGGETPSRAFVQLEEPVRASAPGQTAVLYAGNLVVGHGTIVASRRPASARAC